MAPFCPKRKYVSITVSKKVEILDKVKDGTLSKKAIAKEFNIPQSTLSTLVKNEKKIREANSRLAPDRKRFKSAAHPQLEDALILWIKKIRANNNIPVDGNVLKAKAEEFSLKMGIQDFHFSNGWMANFKKRHGLIFRKVCGESASADPVVAANWRCEKFQEILKEYNPDDIFNADETALFFKLLPEKTLVFKGESCSGGKRAKERITVMVAANMSGTEKLKLLVIGKYKNPRCFKGIRSMPVTYTANKKAWMTQTLYEDWVVSLDRKFSRTNRKIILIVDNCTAHGSVENLSSVRIEYLPPNVTSILQPMDQGIINNLKVHYRRSLLNRMVLTVDRGMPYEINILGAIHLLSAAWEAVSQETIANCFRHPGFVGLPADRPNRPSTSVDIEDLDSSPTTSVDLNSRTASVDADLNDIFETCNIPDGVNLQDYITVNDDVRVHDEMSDDEIITTSRLRPAASANQDSSEEDDVGDACTKSRPTATEFIAAADIMRSFFERLESSEESVKMITVLENKGICNNRLAMKQDAITSYFSPR